MKNADQKPCIVVGVDGSQESRQALRWAVRLATAMDAVFGADRPRNLRMLVREGHPAEILVGRSTTASLVVVGSRGMGAIKGLLQGSVSRYVSEHSVCPVLIVRADDDVNAAE
jgi:nucleotide-binding universal stress UspA family protein